MTEKKTGCQEQGQEDRKTDRRIEKRQEDRNKEMMAGKELILTCRSSVILIPFCHSEQSACSEVPLSLEGKNLQMKNSRSFTSFRMTEKMTGWVGKVQEDWEEFEVGSK